MRDQYTVYKHTSPSGKVYVGITSVLPEERWKNGHGYHNNKHFANAIKKYGWEKFTHEVLCVTNKADAEQLETELIKQYKSNNPLYGYNLAAGGKSNNGYHHRQDTKNRIAKKLVGVPHTLERRENQSKAHKLLWENRDYRKRMSDAHKGKCTGKENPTSKKVVCYDENGFVYGVFDSMGEAERRFKIRHQQISVYCRCTKMLNGYTWRIQDYGH